jgi:hypothetical protein
MDGGTIVAYRISLLDLHNEAIVKKIDVSLRAEYSPIILYVEDLNEIFSIIADVCKNIKINDGNYEYDNTEEFLDKNKDRELYNIEITATEPYVCTDRVIT